VTAASIAVILDGARVILAVVQPSTHPMIILRQMLAGRDHQLLIFSRLTADASFMDIRLGAKTLNTCHFKREVSVDRPLGSTIPTRTASFATTDRNPPDGVNQ
jgi:hypothetical protein